MCYVKPAYLKFKAHVHVYTLHYWLLDMLATQIIRAFANMHILAAHKFSDPTNKEQWNTASNIE